ncbi:hypothetical protein DERF_006614 [Dermatophagoides farinae]|uniref:Uncharacterized protein n=1 Tax=Dermatophagoides farinae TaxID=6954 RepID=A0A922HXM3_DERFA|nr:hypothetical protein DERF_006614 [Dermatophagoides farinae]
MKSCFLEMKKNEEKKRKKIKHPSLDRDSDADSEKKLSLLCLIFTLILVLAAVKEKKIEITIFFLRDLIVVFSLKFSSISSDLSKDLIISMSSITVDYHVAYLMMNVVITRLNQTLRITCTFLIKKPNIICINRY